MKKIDPILHFGRDLLEVEQPARYIGGEYGCINKNDAVLSFGIAFPDLYEIGMSNQALRIIYNNANAIDNVKCERVFAPAPDFEQFLVTRNTCLYTLESGIPLNNLDILGFSIGYELGITGVLSILNSGKIPLLCRDRTDADPIIIAGGPAISNPLPFIDFIDAFWIGEAEAGFFDLLGNLARQKMMGKGRPELFTTIKEHENIYIPGKKTRRALYADFGKKKESTPCIFPIANIKTVQDHGTVEIMRGCPNGCRFCHAGLWYRPTREKSDKVIEDEVEALIADGGYREITLSSLSSGDYSGIAPLIQKLTANYRDRQISFQLPSLKVSSFSLPLLESLSEVRRSGLTFAVETPSDAWQFAINKEVCKDQVVEILLEAKRHGWKKAKFYFMIGLPLPQMEYSEEDAIINFIESVYSKVRIDINVNIGTFIPKAHTAYQWAKQLDWHEARDKLNYIHNHFKKSPIKIRSHDPFLSTLEGVLSRGDSRIGALILSAFEQGCRLDAWEEHLKHDVWQTILNENETIVKESLAERQIDENLPWNEINPGYSVSFLRREYQRSFSMQLTEACKDNCIDENCGICNKKVHVVRKNIHEVPNPKSDFPTYIKKDPGKAVSTGPTFRMAFSYSKTGKAIFIPHLSLIDIFSKAFIRSSLPVKYTLGFNPLPRLDIASPLSVGIASNDEIASIDTHEYIDSKYWIQILNRVLPEGIHINNGFSYTIPEGVKKHSIASLLWGFDYSINHDGITDTVRVKSKDEKTFRQETCERFPNMTSSVDFLCRSKTLAKSALGDPIDYFECLLGFYS